MEITTANAPARAPRAKNIANQSSPVAKPEQNEPSEKWEPSTADKDESKDWRSRVDWGNVEGVAALAAMPAVGFTVEHFVSAASGGRTGMIAGLIAAMAAAPAAIVATRLIAPAPEGPGFYNEPLFVV